LPTPHQIGFGTFLLNTLVFISFDGAPGQTNWLLMQAQHR